MLGYTICILHSKVLCNCGSGEYVYIELYDRLKTQHKEKCAVCYYLRRGRIMTSHTHTLKSVHTNIHTQNIQQNVKYKFCLIHI